MTPVIRAAVIACRGAMVVPLPGAAQRPDGGSGYRSEVVAVSRSPVSGATYRLHVLLPPEYDAATTGLPVLYYVSPSTYWNDSEALHPGRSGATAPSDGQRVFVAVGSREMAIMRRSADALTAALQREDDIEVRYQVYDGADHLTVLPIALIDGLQYLYGRRGH